MYVRPSGRTPRPRPGQRGSGRTWRVPAHLASAVVAPGWCTAPMTATLSTAPSLPVRSGWRQDGRGRWYVLLDSLQAELQVNDLGSRESRVGGRGMVAALAQVSGCPRPGTSFLAWRLSCSWKPLWPGQLSTPSPIRPSRCGPALSPTLTSGRRTTGP
jgi:hypothetical protein